MKLGVQLGFLFWLIVSLALLTGCTEKTSSVESSCVEELSQYQWLKTGVPFKSVSTITTDPSVACGEGYLACVVPFGDMAYLILPTNASLCLIEHERLHLLGYTHPL